VRLHVMYSRLYTWTRNNYILAFDGVLDLLIIIYS